MTKLSESEARAKHASERDEARKVAGEHILDKIQRMIDFLQINVDHIGAIGITVVAKDGDSLYDPVDGDATDASVMKIAYNRFTAYAAVEHARQSLMDPGNYLPDGNSRIDGLAGLLAALQSKKDEDDE